MRTQICITTDIEFSIGGAFSDPVRNRPIGEPHVTCFAENKENGLGFLLDTFSQYGIDATFFVESLQSTYFGDAPMGRIVERILKAGQDVQLHIHPCWLTFQNRDWPTQVAQARPNDDCDGRSLSEMRSLIEEGIKRLLRLCSQPPIAMRTGNLRADRTIYEAMSLCNLHLASNVGMAVFPPGDQALRLTGGRHWIGDVLEVPVLTYTQLPISGTRQFRLLTITASSWREIESLLWQARGRNVETIVVLTHAFEYVKWDRKHINRINKRRLERLCRFIYSHPQEFVATSFRRSAPSWLDSSTQPAPALRAPLGAVLHRIAQNAANDRFLRL